jgi:hypothetical protein
MDNARIFFVSGVSGVGKTAALKELKKTLSSAEYDVRDLDERGVPDGGGFDWLKSETRHWIDVANANAKEGKNTIVCGFANPEMLDEVHQDSDVPCTPVLLHASGETIRQRLIGRYPTEESVREIMRASGTSLEAFIQNSMSFAPQLREIFEKRQLPIIDTDDKTPEQVGNEVAELIRNT